MRAMSLDVQASIFAHFGDEKRRVSLRHQALITSMYYRHFPDSGPYASARDRFQAAWMEMAERVNRPGGTGSFEEPQRQ